MDEIKILNKQIEWEESYRLFHELDNELKLDDFLSTVKSQHNQSLLIFGLYSQNQLVSVACTYIINVINGDKVLWIFDMVTTEKMRGKNFGSKLIYYLEDYARKSGFAELRVHSKNSRERAHHFYRDRNNFKNWSTIFKKEIK